MRNENEVYIKSGIDIPESTHNMVKEIRQGGVHSGKYADLIKFACQTLLYDQPRYDRIDDMLKRIESTGNDFELNKKELKSLMLDVIYEIKQLSRQFKALECAVNKKSVK